MGSNLMQVDDQILALAQREKRACSSIVYSLETLAWPQLHSRAQDFSVVRKNFDLKFYLLSWHTYFLYFCDRNIVGRS